MNTRVGDTPGFIPGPGTQGIRNTQTVDSPTGQGVAAFNGPTPNVAAPGFGVLLQALRNFGPQVGSDFEARLADITSKLRDVSGEVQTDRVLNDQESKRLNMKENQAKIEESEKKLEEAEAKRESGNIFQMIAMAFQALGAILMIALGALLSAVPGMQVVAGLMIAAGVMMAISLVNSIVQQTNEGAGILGSIVKAAGGDEKAIMGADMGFMAAMVVASIVMAVFTGGASTAATAAQVASSMATGIKTASTAVNVATSVGGALAQVGSASYNLSAAQDSKEAADLQADSKEIEALMQQLDDLIDQAMEILMAQANRFNAVADTMTDMMNETGQTLANTRFAG